MPILKPLAALFFIMTIIAISFWFFVESDIFILRSGEEEWYLAECIEKK